MTAWAIIAIPTAILSAILLMGATGTHWYNKQVERREAAEGIVSALFPPPALRQSKPERMRARVGEPFTATTDCPKCGKLDVHWIEEPRHLPTLPLSPTGEQLAMYRISTMMLFADYDPPNIHAVRVCTTCDHRWGQS